MTEPVKNFNSKGSFWTNLVDIVEDKPADYLMTPTVWCGRNIAELKHLGDKTAGRKALDLFLAFVSLLLFTFTLPLFALGALIKIGERGCSLEPRPVDTFDKPRFRRMDPKVAGYLYEMQAALGVVLDKYGVLWFAEAGSLLGLERHGGLIPWDDDIDIKVYPGEQHKLRDPNLIADLRACGLEIKDHWQGFKIFPLPENMPEWGRETGEKGYTYKWPFIDIFTTVKHKSRLVYSSLFARMCWPKDYHTDKEVFGTDGKRENGVIKAKFGPIEINAPRHLPAYLKRSYGPNCMRNGLQSHDHGKNRKIRKIAVRLRDFSSAHYILPGKFTNMDKTPIDLVACQCPGCKRDGIPPVEDVA